MILRTDINKLVKNIVMIPRQKDWSENWGKSNNLNIINVIRNTQYIDA